MRTRPRVLDVGCTGTRPYDADWVHGALRERTDQLVGIDINEGALAAMRARGFNVEVHDPHRLSLLGKFDTIVAGEVIEHIQNPAPFLERARDTWLLAAGSF